MVVVGAALLGLIIGPWLGIVVDRSVERLRPDLAHRCRWCQHRLGPGSLIPVLHWRQRCGECDRHKGGRYLAVDGVTAATFALLAARFGLDWQLGPYLGVAAAVVVLSVIDVETHLLPNVIMWPAIWASLFVVLVVSGEAGEADRLYASLWGAAVFAGVIGLAHLVYERGMGRGDVKLALLLGLFVGWLQPDLLLATRLVLYALVIATLGGGLVGLGVNAIRRRRDEVPFGPALATGALVVILASPAVVVG